MIEIVNTEGLSLGVYTDTDMIQRELGKGNIEVPICNGGFIRKKWDFEKEKWMEGCTQDEINEFNYQDNLKQETERYVQRAKDGRLAYAEISAEFRLAKLNGIVSEEAHASIEKALILVRNEVLAGQWISAKNELIILGSSVIGIDLYNRLLNQIEIYISENY